MTEGNSEIPQQPTDAIEGKEGKPRKSEKPNEEPSTGTGVGARVIQDGYGNIRVVEHGTSPEELRNIMTGLKSEEPDAKTDR